MSEVMGTERRAVAATHREAWIALAFGGWVVGGFLLALWAITTGRAPDAAASPFHLPVYASIVALAAFVARRAWQSRRRGRGWSKPMPDGFGTLAAGLVALVAAIVLDVGWREGVGIGPGVEGSLAPSRIVLAVGLVLVGATPLVAALRLGREHVPWPTVVGSAALVLGAIAWPGGFHPVENAWLEEPEPEPGTTGELWLMDADGSHQTRLVEAELDESLGYASWSPDGSTIAYTRFGGIGGSVAEARAEIWVTGAAGDDAVAVLSGPDWSWIPRVSPDGEWIIYTREAQGGPWMDEGPVGPGAGGQAPGPLSVPLPQAEIWRARTDGSGEPERLTESDGDDRAPVYSPDGSRVLFDSTRDGNTEIYVMNADGSEPTRLTNDPGEDWGASWSPDGSRIAFNSSRTGDMEIYVMAADGTDLRQLTDDDSANTSPTWSPDGTRIAYSARDAFDAGQIWSIADDGSDPRNLSRSPALNDHVWTGGWGADGRIVFARSLPATPERTGLARENLGAAALLISSVATAVVMLLLVRTGAPLGSATIAGTAGLALIAAPLGDWRFVVVGAAVGVLVDLVGWRVTGSRHGPAVAAVAAAGFALGSGAVILATSAMAWSPTLFGGVALVAGASGWALGAVADRAP